MRREHGSTMRTLRRLLARLSGGHRPGSGGTVGRAGVRATGPGKPGKEAGAPAGAAGPAAGPTAGEGVGGSGGARRRPCGWLTSRGLGTAPVVGSGCASVAPRCATASLPRIRSALAGVTRSSALNVSSYSCEPGCSQAMIVMCIPGSDRRPGSVSSAESESVSLLARIQRPPLDPPSDRTTGRGHPQPFGGGLAPRWTRPPGRKVARDGPGGLGERMLAALRVAVGRRWAPRGRERNPLHPGGRRSALFAGLRSTLRRRGFRGWGSCQERFRLETKRAPQG